MEEILQILRSPWAFLVLASGPALAAWLLVERFLRREWYYLLEFKGKRLFFALWVVFILARLLLSVLLPWAEPMFFWTSVVCCLFFVAIFLWEVPHIIAELYRQRRLRHEPFL